MELKVYDGVRFLFSPASDPLQPLSFSMSICQWFDEERLDMFPNSEIIYDTCTPEPGSCIKGELYLCTFVCVARPSNTRHSSREEHLTKAVEAQSSRANL